MPVLLLPLVWCQTVVVDVFETEALGPIAEAVLAVAAAVAVAMTTARRRPVGTVVVVAVQR
jgi:hypothetical protein